MRRIVIFLCLLFIAKISLNSQEQYEKDSFDTPEGKLTIHFIGHGTLFIEFNRKIIHVDPWSQLADYKTLPKADIILLTHHHYDHLDTSAVEMTIKKGTKIFLNQATYDILKKGTVMRNGDKKKVAGIEVEAVPAYNVSSGRDKYHPKGRDNGYVVTTGTKRIYIAGDTENIPEMANQKNIDIAFLPMNQPYTMVPEQVADAVSKLNPKILYPYHYGDSDLSMLRELLAKNINTELRIRKMK